MPLLQRLSKQVGCRIWDAIQAKLKEIQQKDKINKTLVDYIFVLFDPCNDATVLRSKLVDFLGDKTDVFVEWFVKVVSQVDNQVTKAQSEIAGKQSSAGAPEGTAATTKPTPSPEKDTSTVPTVKTDPPSEAQPPIPAATSGSESPHKTEADKRREAEAENDWESDPSRSRHHHRSGRRREHRGNADPNREQPKSGVSRILTKAARDAVKSVQAVSAAQQDVPLVEKKKSEEKVVQPEEEIMVIEADATEEAIIDQEALKSDDESRGQPIAVKIGRGGGQKRAHEERERDIRSVTAPVPAPVAPTRADSPLIVPDYRHQEETENVLDQDSEEIPGLLVVMPSHPSSRVIMGQHGFGRNRWGMFSQPEFTVSGIGRPPFQPPSQHAMGGDEMDVDGPPPAKRMRPGGKPPVDTSSIPCRFLPHCAKKAGICPYFHPVCRNGKHCRFGATCVFDHSGASTAEGPKKQAPPVPTKIPFCIYAPFCTQPRCKFLHKQPVVCTFGAQCRMGAARCAFLHPEDLADGESTVGDRSDLQITDLEEDSEFEGDVTGGDAESVDGQFTVSAPHPEMDQPEPMPI